MLHFANLRRKIASLIVCLLTISPIALWSAEETTTRIVNGTLINLSLDYPGSPFITGDPAAGGPDLNFERRWVTEERQLILSCLPGNTAKITTPGAEGGSVIVDNFLTVNDDPDTEGIENNVCDLGTFPGLEAPTGNFNCFQHPGDGVISHIAGALINDPLVGFDGVGEIIVPVGSTIPLGTQQNTFQTWDFGSFFGNTTLDLVTTCRPGEWPIELTAEIDVCCGGDDEDSFLGQFAKGDDGGSCPTCEGSGTVDFLELASEIEGVVEVLEVRVFSSGALVVGRGDGADCSFVGDAGEDLSCDFDLADPFLGPDEEATELQACVLLKDLVAAEMPEFEICGRANTLIRRGTCDDDDD